MYRLRNSIVEMNSEEQLSIILSKALDAQGYSNDVVTARRAAYNSFSGGASGFMKQHNPGLDIYMTLTGSTREGVAARSGSDRDFMITFNDIVCSDKPVSVRRDVSYIFELDKECCPHGYTKLRLFHRNVNKTFFRIEKNLVKYPDGSAYLSSAKFMSDFLSMSEPVPDRNIFVKSRLPRAGPSAPRTGQIPLIGLSSDMDCVAALPCQCTEYLQSWMNRPRDNDWPSREQIETAATLDAHVVPVSAKGSDDEPLQWRICFTLTEINLMQSLTETKWKLYVTLKMIRDAVFKPLGGDLLTSYVLKNVIMWISEFDPEEEFQPKYLLHKLRQCVNFLMLGFCSRRIPNYMISKRNLFHGRLTDQNKKVHLEALNSIHQDLPAAILRCPALTTLMVEISTTPDKVMAEMAVRNQNEMIALRLLASSQDKLFRFINRMYSSSCTLPDIWDLIQQVMVHHAEVVASGRDIPVSAVKLFALLDQLLPPEVQLNRLRSAVEEWRQ